MAMGMDSERVAYNPIMFGPGGTGQGDGLFGAGGGGLIGGLLLGTLLRGGTGGLFGGGVGAGVAAAEITAGDIAAKVVALQNSTNIIDAIGSLGNEIQVSLNAANMNNSNNFRGLDNQICGLNTNLSNLNFAQTIQNMNNTSAIQNQASGFQVINQENFCAVKELIHTDGDATRSLITQNLIDGLRAELALERRGRDQRETEITITNTNTQTQNVLQAQMQQQGIIFANALNALGDQVNRAANSVVNVGSGTVAGGQTNSQANTKVNS